MFPRASFRFAGSVLGLLLLTVVGARAHDPFESTTVVRLRPATLELEVTLARSTALSVAKDGRPGPTFEPAVFDTLRPLFIACAPDLFVITRAGERLEPGAVRVALSIEDDVEFHVVYPRPPPGPLDFHALHIDRLGTGFGSVVTFDLPPGPSPLPKLLMGSDTRFQVDLPGAGGESGPVAAADRTPVFGPFLHLGVLHILTGYDHLLFLLGLLIVCRGAGPTLGIVTCFTLAHSVTLAIAALGVFSLPGHIVEPLIAASIIFVGIENLARREAPTGRWAVAFAFGLLHGFGFAGALRATGLGAGEQGLILPLFAFNLGVELGQLALVAVALPLLARLRKHPVPLRRVQVIVSVLVAGAGLFWLAQRTVFS